MSACQEFYPRCLCNQCAKKGNGCCIKHHRVCHEANNYVDSNVCSGFVKKDIEMLKSRNDSIVYGKR